MLVNQPSAMPTRKVQASGATGSLVFIVSLVFAIAGIELPAEVVAAVSTLLSFFVAYMTREKA